MPRVSVVAGRTYEEVVALPDEPQGPWTRITYARQDVRLTADERGADVDAEAVLVAYGAMPRRVVLSGPFLLAMLAPGSDRPYVVAWIGTADALSRWGDPIGVPLCAAEAARFAGAWTLDPDASLRATVDFVLQQVGTSNPGMEPGRLLRDLRPHFESRTFGLAIAADGAARVDARRPDGRTPRASVRLSRDGARVLLVVPLPRGSPSEGDGEGEDAAAEERWTVARDGEETLRLTGSGEVLVLRRR